MRFLPKSTTALVVVGALAAVMLCVALTGTAVALVQLHNQGNHVAEVVQSTAKVSKANAKNIRDIETARKTNLQTREESTRLLCDINHVLVAFITAPPDLPRDPPALKRLKAERCGVLLAKVKVKK